VGDIVISGPVCLGIVKTERRHCRVVWISIDVRETLADRQRLGPYGRVDHVDLDKGRLPFPVVEQVIAIIQDSNPVGLGDRLHHPLPDSEPIAVRHQPKIRKIIQNRPVLVADRQPTHQTSSPKKR
jgi:hypothetical protein